MRPHILVPLLLHDMRHALQQPDAVLGLAADLAGQFFKSAAQHGIVFVFIASHVSLLLAGYAGQRPADCLSGALAAQFTAHCL